MKLKELTAHLHIASALIFSFLLIVLQIITPNYNLQTNVISDLGVNPASAGIFNALLITAGISIIIISILRANITKDFTFCASLLICGFGFAAAGYYPKSINLPHIVAAALAFLALVFVMLYSCRLVSGLYQRIFALLGVISLVAVIVFAFYLTNSLIENLIILPFLIWNIFAGFHLLKN